MSSREINSLIPMEPDWFFCTGAKKSKNQGLVGKLYLGHNLLENGTKSHGTASLQRNTHFFVQWSNQIEAKLPKDISVLWALDVDDEFHARYSAQSRTYQYLILNFLYLFLWLL